MNYFPVSTIVLVFFACDTVCGAYGSGYLTIEVRNIKYINHINYMNLTTYIYTRDDSLELKCELNDKEPKSVIEWTDEKNKISHKSCFGRKVFKLILEKLGEDDNQAIFTCNSTNYYKTLTLELKDRTDSRKIQKDNSEICYKIVRESNKNCSYKSREEVITRKRTSCPSEMSLDINDQNATKNVTDIFGKRSTQELQNDPGGSTLMMMYAGVVVCLFISLAIITFCMCKWYDKIKKRINRLPYFVSRNRVKNNEHIYEEPNVIMYAELQVANVTSPPVLPNRNYPPYAQIVGVLTPAPAPAPVPAPAPATTK